MSSTGTDAGEVIDGGLRAPPGRIVNVAGIRTLLAPTVAVDPVVRGGEAGPLVVVTVGTLSALVVLAALRVVEAEDSELWTLELVAACLELPQAATRITGVSTRT